MAINSFLKDLVRSPITGSSFVMKIFEEIRRRVPP